MRSASLVAALSFAAAAAAAQAPPPLFDNLGTFSRRISTRVPLAQRYFDQGLRLTYGFNHGEAIRAFREAARLDSTCAICWWAVANAYGPNINLPMDSASGAAAWEAIQRAVALRSHASPVERALIDATVPRFGADPTADRARRDSAWVDAVTAVARRFPADLEVATLRAEALMDLRPWNYWASDGSAYPGVESAVAILESVLRRAPRHPGACHFYIHAVEASPRPERALPCAERLAALVPGAGHLVHMPAHIYIRLGMYDRAEQANMHAAHTDESYIADAHPDGVYPVAYYPHNLHFLWAANAFAGRRADAAAALVRLRAAAPPSLAIEQPPFELFVLPAFYHLVWFGQWDAALSEPRPPAALLMASGLWFYTRGRAFAATGRLAEARAALDSLVALRRDAPSRIPDGITVGFAPPTTLLDIARAVLEGDLAAREHRTDDAVARLRAAVALADGLTYNEPADWYPSPRLTLGSILLEAGRFADAEAVYREDLVRNRDSGWALAGLERALTAQGKRVEASAVLARRRRAFATADADLR